MLKKDTDHDGLLTEKEFLQAAELASLGSLAKDREAMELLRLRYDEHQDGRINILSLLYDLYSINSKTEASIGGFVDFPAPSRSQQGAASRSESSFVMSDLIVQMEKQRISAESIASQLIDEGRSNRIKTSLLLLKVNEVMEDALYSTSKSTGSGRTAEESARTPFHRLIQVVEAIDELGRGNVLDYHLVSFLNSFLNTSVRTFMNQLIDKLNLYKTDLRGYLSGCVAHGDLVPIQALRLFFKKEGFLDQIVEKTFDKLRLVTSEVPLVKLQQKIEREMTLLKTCGSVEIIRNYIYGKSLSDTVSTVDLGVDTVITQIHEGLLGLNADFNARFNYPATQMLHSKDFRALLSKIGVTKYDELEKLVLFCKDKRDPSLVNMSLFKEVYDSKYGLGAAETANTKQVKEQLIKSINQTIQHLGFNPLSLFARADKNKTNSLDRRVAPDHAGVLLPALPARRHHQAGRSQHALRRHRHRQKRHHIDRRVREAVRARLGQPQVQRPAGKARVRRADFHADQPEARREPVSQAHQNHAQAAAEQLRQRQGRQSGELPGHAARPEHRGVQESQRPGEAGLRERPVHPREPLQEDRPNRPRPAGQLPEHLPQQRGPVGRAERRVHQAALGVQTESGARRRVHRHQAGRPHHESRVRGKRGEVHRGLQQGRDRSPRKRSTSSSAWSRAASLRRTCRARC